MFFDPPIKAKYTNEDAFAQDRDNWLFQDYDMQLEKDPWFGPRVYRFEKGFDIFYVEVG